MPTPPPFPPVDPVDPVHWHEPSGTAIGQDDPPALIAWQRHVDAGRIGRRETMRAADRTAIAAMAAILRQCRAGGGR